MLILFRISGDNAEKVSFILGKNPANIFEREVSGGKARLYYTKYEKNEVHFAFDVEMDTITELKEGNIDGYVSDRPFVPSTLLTVAMNSCIKGAMNSPTDDLWDIEVEIPNVPTRDNEFTTNVFAPLGYVVDVRDQLDCDNHKTLVIKKHTGLHEVLNHIYILVPLFDGKKHYIINNHEAEKLVTKTESWLRDHPMRNWILKRFLGYRKSLIDAVEEAIADDEDVLNEEVKPEKNREEFIKLHKQRHFAVLDKISDSQSVLEIGCGNGKFLREFNARYPDKKILGIDYSSKDLYIAKKKIKHPNVTIKFGSAIIIDPKLHENKFDTVVLTEVIEHIDFDQLPLMWENIKAYQPKQIIITTPNRTYNRFFEGMAEGELRHWDHKFEFTKDEFVQHLHEYFPAGSIDISGVGLEKEGEFPSLMAVITNNTSPSIKTQFVLNYQRNLLPADSYLFMIDKLKAGLEEYHFRGVHPENLWYVPPTIAPAETVIETGELEHPSTAISYYASKGITSLIAQEKHMGSRGIIVLKRDGTGSIYTKSGKRFFDDQKKESAILKRLLVTCDKVGVNFQDIMILDTEIMPWNLKAHHLIERQFKPMFVTGMTKFEKLSNALEDRYVDIASSYRDRISDYKSGYAALNRCIDDRENIKIAPFAVLKLDNKPAFEMPYSWHMIIINTLLSSADPDLIKPTRFSVVPEDFERFFNDITAGGGEGIVVKPYFGLNTKQDDGKICVPGVKVRGREYLRIIYGPEYLKSLEKLQKRPLGRKRMLSALQHKLGLMSLGCDDPSKRFNICLHSLSLNAEPIDPRL